MTKILIIDDEAPIRRVLRDILENESYQVDDASTGMEALQHIKEQDFDAIFCDIKMPEMDGIEVLEAIRKESDVPVIMLSGHGTIETAVEAIKKGAFDFIPKPPDLNRLLITLRNALDKKNLATENKVLKKAVKLQNQMIGESGPMQEVKDMIGKVAPTNARVLITGENGTGKELVARQLHELSTRCHGPFIEVNCAAIPAELIESQLFGHEKGSFTGAYDTRKGYFEVADGGTLFLDEVGELPLATQARLLRVLENGEFIKVGSSKIQKTNVRVVAATNVDIPMAIEKGRFREDLYYRLNTVPIHIPALRERKDDIKLLFRKFASDFAEKYHIPAVTLTPEALTMLENYRWDGNIRQLKNVTEQISIIETERVITPEILKNYLPEQTALPAIFKDESKADSISERDLLYKVLFDMKKDIAELRKTVDELTAGQIPTTTQIATPIKATVINSTNNTDLVEYENTQDAEVEYLQEKHVVDNLSLQDKENEVIIKVLQKHNGKRKDAAKELGISERTLCRKIKEYNINM